MEKSIIIGLDIGTTSVKAVAFSRGGRVIGEQEIAYPLSTPFPGWAEQDPLEIEAATITVIRNLIQLPTIDEKNILAIGLSTAMHSLICMAENGEPLSPSITWADGRASLQANRLRVEHNHIYDLTGTPIHPMSPLVKLIWMKENNYLPYQQASYFVSIKEFILYRWFGCQSVDYAVASATGLLDLHHLKWNKEALELAGVSEAQLFKPVSPTEVLVDLDKTIADQIGLPVHIPFVIGSSDGPLANIGLGAINPGEVAITIGTSGAIRQIVTEPKSDSLQQTFCYGITESLSLIGGPTNNGGIVLQWLKETLDIKETYEELISVAEKAEPGAEGLLFLPYLNGERAPIWNANVRASLFGLSLRHKKEHIVRAGLEGVIYSVFHVGQALERLAGKPTTLLASGGFGRSPLWLQITADVFNQEVQVPISHQSSAWGAAWMALFAIGEVTDLASIKQAIPMQENYMPNPDHHKIYMDLFKLYQELSHTTHSIYMK
ncbi:gluconokinase [Bacillus mesophilus]|uniref:Gluconokinase n=2 Tax=Bacillus mesophilus TaxID=1808955 RepID=A0A6M0QBK6_9BACI|nr:gluconokinase [Bacillus mesophilus]MBM7660099.1 gluconokinase [Bacillus mesophilus]NEY73754.1 gluconokinase [Bacillus mesophilus]